MSAQPPLFPSNCANCEVRYGAVCAGCETSELEALETIKSYSVYPAGTVIASAGEDLERIGTIISGVAAMNHLLEDGRRQVVGLLLPSDFVGRPDRRIAPYDVVAATDVQMCQFEREAFCALLDRSPVMARRLLSMTLDELDAAREWMTLLGRKTALEKTASFFVMLMNRTIAKCGPQPPESLVISIPLSRADLSDYLGLTIETTSRQFSRLAKSGVVVRKTKNEFVIPNVSALRSCAASCEL